MIAANPAHQLNAVVGSEREIDHSDIRLGAVDGGLRGLHGCSLAGEHELALTGEQLFQTFPDERMVIDDQNPCWICHGWLFPTYFASRDCNNGGWTSTCNLATAQEWSNPHFPQCSHGDTFQTLEDRPMNKDSPKPPTEPLRFVLLEDDPNDAELIQLQLARNGLDIAWRHVV